jgi:hypothetical protein
MYFFFPLQSPVYINILRSLDLPVKFKLDESEWFDWRFQWELRESPLSFLGSSSHSSSQEHSFHFRLSRRELRRVLLRAPFSWLLFELILLQFWVLFLPESFLQCSPSILRFPVFIVIILFQNFGEILKKRNSEILKKRNPRRVQGIYIYIYIYIYTVFVNIPRLEISSVLCVKERERVSSFYLSLFICLFILCVCVSETKRERLNFIGFPRRSNSIWERERVCNYYCWFSLFLKFISFHLFIFLELIFLSYIIPENPYFCFLFYGPLGVK